MLYATHDRRSLQLLVLLSDSGPQTLSYILPSMCCRIQTRARKQAPSWTALSATPFVETPLMDLQTVHLLVGISLVLNSCPEAWRQLHFMYSTATCRFRSTHFQTSALQCNKRCYPPFNRPPRSARSMRSMLPHLLFGNVFVKSSRKTATSRIPVSSMFYF